MAFSFANPSGDIFMHDDFQTERQKLNLHFTFFCGNILLTSHKPLQYFMTSDNIGTTSHYAVMIASRAFTIFILPLYQDFPFLLVVMIHCIVNNMHCDHSLINIWYKSDWSFQWSFKGFPWEHLLRWLKNFFQIYATTCDFPDFHNAMLAIHTIW